MTGVGVRVCVCPLGVDCVDECESVPCQNDGGCVNELGGFRCECLDGFNGTVCEQVLDPCLAVVCRNGGACVLNGKTGAAECECVFGFAGAECEIDVDECALGACANGAACVDGPGSVECTCAEGFTGVFCEESVAGAVAQESGSGESGMSTAMVAAIGGAVVGVFVLVLLVLLILMRRRQRQVARLEPVEQEDVHGQLERTQKRPLMLTASKRRKASEEEWMDYSDKANDELVLDGLYGNGMVGASTAASSEYFFGDGAAAGGVYQNEAIAVDREYLRLLYGVSEEEDVYGRYANTARADVGASVLRRAGSGGGDEESGHYANGEGSVEDGPVYDAVEVDEGLYGRLSGSKRGQRGHYAGLTAGETEASGGDEGGYANNGRYEPRAGAGQGAYVNGSWYENGHGNAYGVLKIGGGNGSNGGEYEYMQEGVNDGAGDGYVNGPAAAAYANSGGDGEREPLYRAVRRRSSANPFREDGAPVYGNPVDRSDSMAVRAVSYVEPLAGAARPKSTRGAGGGAVRDERMEQRRARLGNMFGYERDWLEMMDPLGSGEFGVVLQAVTSDGGQSAPRFVAVKVLREGAGAKEQGDFLGEAELVSKFEHENVLGFVGVCVEQEPWMTVLEYAPYGDLRTFLRTCISLPGMEVQSVELIEFGRQIAAGMEYLGSWSIVHRDLAARNCLLGQNSVVKIADFGLSRRVEETEGEYVVRSRGKLPARWMAIESLAFRRFTSASDMWSFGVVLWELFTYGAIRPYRYVDVREILTALESGVRLGQPRGCPDEVFELMALCWETDARKRPSFEYARETLTSIVHDHVQLGEVPRQLGRLAEEMTMTVV
jgi:HAMP domain-containing protein